MKIKMTVKKIHYGDVAVKAIPALSARMHQESAAAHIFAALAQLSEQTIYQIFDQIPQQDKKQIVSLLCKENHDRILTMGNRLLEEKEFPLC